MPRYKLTIEYNGTHYCGWQKQDNTPTIQGSIEAALQQFCGTTIEIVGAGRTDSGVHAIAQVAHIDLPKDYEPFQVMQGINYYLFNSANVEEALHNRIAIVDAARVSEDFNARFSAIKRHYLYRIINRRPRLGLDANRAWHVVEPLDENGMHAAAQILVGHHDFTSFRDTQCQAKSPVKTLDQLDVSRTGDEIQIIASARSFLHHQVRNITGTLALVGKGKWQARDVEKALEARDRTQAGPTAPSDGLYLTRVDY